jgi:pilus assembly protein CpaE
MSTQAIKTLFALDDGVEMASMGASLAVTAPLQIVGFVEGLDASWRSLEETSPDLLVVVTKTVSEKALYLIASASKQRTDRPIVVLYDGAANGFMHRAFEAGADDLVILPESPDRIQFALEKAVARKRGTAALGGQAPMICMLGPKGGTGKTLTACNLSVALALAGKRPVLVDLDLQFGDVGIALGLSPDRTMYDLVRAGGSLDSEKVESFLTTHSSGLRVLLGPTRPDQAGLVGVEFVRDVLKTLRGSSDVVVVDTPPSFSPEVIATIDAASHLCMVGALDALSLKDSKLGLETLDLMGHKGPKVKFVLNRADAGSGISRRDAEAILGVVPEVFVPDEKEIVRGITEGVPIVMLNERSVASRAFRDLAKAYIQEFEAVERLASAPEELVGKAKRGRAGLVLGRRR